VCSKTLEQQETSEPSFQGALSHLKYDFDYPSPSVSSLDLPPAKNVNSGDGDGLLPCFFFFDYLKFIPEKRVRLFTLSKLSSVAPQEILQMLRNPSLNKNIVIILWINISANTEAS
jgi:hypothetical protein